MGTIVKTKTIKLKKFDVKKIASKEIVYRDGKEVKEIFLTEHGSNENKIVTISNDGKLYGHHKNGRYMAKLDTSFDLFFK